MLKLLTFQSFIAMNPFAKSAVTIVLKSCRNRAGKSSHFIFIYVSIFSLLNAFKNNILTHFTRCGFMYGELTDKETVARLEYTLENQQQDQFEILLYKKNSE